MRNIYIGCKYNFSPRHHSFSLNKVNLLKFRNTDNPACTVCLHVVVTKLAWVSKSRRLIVDAMRVMRTLRQIATKYSD